MNDHEINIAIAEACGWRRGYTERSGFYVVDPHGIQRGWSKLEDVAISALPDYLTDLNAMHEAEKVLTYPQECLYHELLKDLTVGRLRTHCATARQRAEAFLRAIGKWKN